MDEGDSWVSVTEGFVYDPFSTEVMANPLPRYEVLREHYPVYYSATYDTFFLSRFEDCWQFLSSVDGTFGSPEGTVMEQGTLLSRNIGTVAEPPSEPLVSLRFSSPVYEEVRQAHGRPFRPGSIRGLEEFIRATARAQLDALIARGRFDLTQDYGGIVAATTMCHMLHIPVSEAKHLLDTVNASTRTDDETGGFDFMAMFEACADILEPVVRSRRASGWDGSWATMDGMFDYRFAGRELSDREVAYNLECVLIGGTETLPKIVAHGLLELVRHPDQLAEVRANLNENCATALEEMNRFCGPAQWFGRTALRDTMLAGQEVKTGQRVVYLLQSAARDPREYGDDASAFRWNREIKRSLAFGRGQHFCIGVHLARLEGRILLEEFLSRVTDYEIDEANAVRLPSSFQWGFNVLPVTINQTVA